MQFFKHRPLTLLHTFCLLSLWSPHLFCGPLADRLTLKESDQQYWQSRSENLLQVEINQQRKLRLQPEELQWAYRALQNNHLITGLNFFINQPSNSNEMMFTPTQLERLKLQNKALTHLIKKLPKLEVESYRALPMSPELIEKLNINSIYYEKGFFRSVGTLQGAYSDAETLKMYDNEKMVIIKIKGQSSRLANLLYQRHEVDIVWLPQSYFKVIDKDYDAAKGIYFFHLQEISTQEARRIGQVISSYTARRIALSSPRCI